MSVLVTMEDVGKIYPRVHRPWERMRAFTAVLRGKEPTQGAEVLKDISLEVRAGESLGIIGENGAGKSTLLKVLTGVVQPTRGRVEVRARTAALLELGAGFEPDFSGLENVKMKASLLGMSHQELNQRLEEILDFADIGEYIHEPVKHYSTGMMVRLGFAVVAASRPELLITDEVLAVGDESFQKKCIRWIEDFRAGGGTLLLVSHSMYIVQKLCQHALWVHRGETREYGEAHAVTQSYLAWHEAKSAAERRLRRQRTDDGGHYRITRFVVIGQEDQDTVVLETGDDVEVELDIHSPDGRIPVGVIGLLKIDGTPIYGVTSEYDSAPVSRLDNGTYRYRMCFQKLPVLPGQCRISGLAMDPEGLRVFDQSELAVRIRGETTELGIVRLPHQWRE